MSEILHVIENFIKAYGFYIVLGMLLLIFICLIIDVCVAASVNKKIKNFEKKYGKNHKKSHSTDNLVSLDTTQKIADEKTFVNNDRPRDNKGRFVKRT